MGEGFPLQGEGTGMGRRRIGSQADGLKTIRYAKASGIVDAVKGDKAYLPYHIFSPKMQALDSGGSPWQKARI